MTPTPVKTPSELADEALNTGRDAVDAASGYASEAKAIGRSTVQGLRLNAEDARATGSEALDTAKGIASDVGDVANDAVKTGRFYVRDAVQSASQKVTALRDKAITAKSDCERFVGDQPGKAVLIAAAGGAVAAMLLSSMVRRRR